MKEREISKSEKIDFAKRNENHFYDNKSIAISGKKIQKISCAFANADGGEFIVGIKEENDPELRWEGVDNQEEFNFVFQNIQELSPTIPHNIEFLKDPKGTFSLRIIIEKSPNVHKTSDDTVYVRNGAQSLPLKDPQKITSLSYSKGESSYEDSLVKDALAEDIFESSKIQEFLNDYSPKSDPIDFTVNQNLVDRITYEPRTAGILLFSENPTPLMPSRCGIKISRYDTSEENPEREHLKEQLSIEEPLYEQIQKAASEITNIMESVHVLTAKGMHKANYPPETIWEIFSKCNYSP